MTLYSDVPQANQQIASTQQPIEDNFLFLQTAIAVDHGFVTTDPTQTFHKQATMPNQGLMSGSLPVGTAGRYYVFNGAPYFYNGLNYNLITQPGGPPFIKQGAVNLANGASAIILPFSSSGYLGSLFVIQQTSPSTFGQTFSFEITSSGSGSTLIINPPANTSPNFTLSLDGSKNLIITSTNSYTTSFLYQSFYSLSVI
jgi:hypothetical protein